MKKWILILPPTIALTAIVTWFASLHVFERPVIGDRVEQETLASDALGEQRAYLVQLPKSYAHEPDHRYPVLWAVIRSGSPPVAGRFTVTNPIHLRATCLYNALNRKADMLSGMTVGNSPRRLVRRAGVCQSQ